MPRTKHIADPPLVGSSRKRASPSTSTPVQRGNKRLQFVRDHLEDSEMTALFDDTPLVHARNEQFEDTTLFPSSPSLHLPSAAKAKAPAPTSNEITIRDNGESPLPPVVLNSLRSLYHPIQVHQKIVEAEALRTAQQIARHIDDNQQLQLALADQDVAHCELITGKDITITDLQYALLSEQDEHLLRSIMMDGKLVEAEQALQKTKDKLEMVESDLKTAQHELADSKETFIGTKESLVAANEQNAELRGTIGMLEKFFTDGVSMVQARFGSR